MLGATVEFASNDDVISWTNAAALTRCCAGAVRVHWPPCVLCVLSGWCGTDIARVRAAGLDNLERARVHVDGMRGCVDARLWTPCEERMDAYCTACTTVPLLYVHGAAVR